MNERIPLVKPDLPPFEEIEGALRDILDSGRVTNFGAWVEALEREAEAYIGVPVVSVSSGSLGLVFALQASGLAPGATVILPSFTFMATAQAVLYAGGTPLFAEVEEDLTMSPADLASLLAARRGVGAVVPVHTYGLPCRVDDLRHVVEEAARASRHRIVTVYDAAHAFGSAVGDGRVGTFGDAEVFSLSATKILVSVEGGLVASHDGELIRRVRRMRNYGIEDGYEAHWPGLNGKMSELHALIGLHNLRRLEAVMEERQRKASDYLARIGRNTGFRTLPPPAKVTHTFKDFTIILPETLAGRRDAVLALLRSRGVDTRAYFFPPVHEQPFFRRFADRPLPRTESLSRLVITVPFYTTMTDAEMDQVVSALAEAERSLA